MKLLELRARERFNLIELIVLIVIISFFAAIMFSLIDPPRLLNESRNTRRWSDVTNIINALIKYQVDNDGNNYTTVDDMTPGIYYQIGTANLGCDSGCTAQATVTACIDLSGIGYNYLATVPNDPLYGSDSETDYYILKDTNGAITVGACDPEGEGTGGSGRPPIITLTR